ncbi:PREDICTED: uncharacterized protein LOC104593437 [Nelumbo nucifera]|uniref:Uncharacterized protein LOC104593437 n=2 Tax=Nelumbo nucifera TaxID=4432 RepID=A0A1U7ZD71_NELNU|nr:PREDICTED: uncharacterized protein LOC104593437 [Nelumbo nucifera]DAD43252.1 TPA_asm: hypothetical protein HUJ06_001482 [Nelumbo nucifera]
MESETHLLEINLISAQGLKPPSANLRRMQTYAVAWIDSAIKLRTRVDRVGCENPTWNDKFIFRVSSAFLSTDTSAVSVEIYVVGYLKDTLIGTVRFLIGNCLSSSAPTFSALQIRRPSSGRFHGVLNIGAMVIKNRTDFAALNGFSAIGYRDLMGKNRPRQSDRQSRQPSKTNKSSFEESCQHSRGDYSGEYSDDSESAASSSTSTTSTVLTDLNGRREVSGKMDEKSSDGGGVRLLCGLGLGFQMKIHLCPLDQNQQISSTASDVELD